MGHHRAPFQLPLRSSPGQFVGVAAGLLHTCSLIQADDKIPPGTKATLLLLTVPAKQRGQLPLSTGLCLARARELQAILSLHLHCGLGWAREQPSPGPNHLSAQFCLMPYQILGSQPRWLPYGAVPGAGPAMLWDNTNGLMTTYCNKGRFDFRRV